MSQVSELDSVDMQNIKIRKKLSECPYNCTQGKVYIPATGLYDDCPHCKDIYEQIAKGKEKDDSGRDIFKILCIPTKYKNTDFDSENFFPRSIIETTSGQSRAEILSELGNIMNIIVRGERISSDYLFYLGMETDILKYIFPLLREGYSNGLKVVPYVNTLELIQLFKLIEEPVSNTYKVGVELEKELGVGYMDYCKADLCVVSLAPSSGQNSINMLFSLLKARHSRGLNTIVFSETVGASRELGYIINNDNFVKRFIEQKQKNTDSDRRNQRTQAQEKSNIMEPVQLQFELGGVSNNYGVIEEDNLPVGKSKEERQRDVRSKF